MHGSGVDGTDDHRDQRLIEGEAEDQDTGQNHKSGHWRFDYEELTFVEGPVNVRQLCAVGDVQPSVQQGVGQQDGRVEGSEPPVYPLVNEQSYYKEQKCDGDRQSISVHQPLNVAGPKGARRPAGLVGFRTDALSLRPDDPAVPGPVPRSPQADTDSVGNVRAHTEVGKNIDSGNGDDGATDG